MARQLWGGLCVVLGAMHLCCGLLWDLRHLTLVGPAGLILLAWGCAVLNRAEPFPLAAWCRRLPGGIFIWAVMAAMIWAFLSGWASVPAEDTDLWSLCAISLCCGSVVFGADWIFAAVQHFRRGAEQAGEKEEAP